MNSSRHQRVSPNWRICAFLVGIACFGPGLFRARAEGCNSKNALFVVGKPYEGSLADEARRRAGAMIVRRMDLGMAYQMEFRADRLDLTVDKKGIVVAIHCG
ncbi:I78 family peptidase inhibitor [Methylosinus sp. sav-2]|jgi:hypothetical protein|uniref:I78 family peptidase inhibitor n=1 Tax=Methylosinus sp. sav-2 TaxID=2485168 RepID=UPI0009FF36FB|nr:I78 family peptidase inhibitor [Methylosinus sp. sav-2]